MPEDVNRLYLAGQFRGPRPDIEIDKDDLLYLFGYIFPFNYNHLLSERRHRKLSTTQL